MVEQKVAVMKAEYQEEISRLHQEMARFREEMKASLSHHQETTAPASDPQVENGFPASLGGRPTNFDEADESPSDSESIGERYSPLNGMASRRYPISDMTIFKYCLASLAEKSLMLKEIATAASDKEMSELAHHVSLYSGCSYHGWVIFACSYCIILLLFRKG
ncbi:hypothetical protein RJT34_20361 [Clitoria ternatea]|uniref:Uncharacterized protein n=1 Tax=Clitoria ternatea TaxID=43366 RepID=A0AAN9ISP3_CLITE